MKFKLLIPVVAIALAAAIYLTLGKGHEENPKEYVGQIYDLLSRSISPDLGKLSVKFVLPRHLKFVAEAPPEVSATSENPRIISLADTDNNDPYRAYIFPIKTSPGETVVSIDYKVFYCEDGPGAICFTSVGRLRIPVTVSAGGEESFKIRHFIEGR
jgi:hypothetical protein